MDRVFTIFAEHLGEDSENGEMAGKIRPPDGAWTTAANSGSAAHRASIVEYRT